MAGVIWRSVDVGSDNVRLYLVASQLGPSDTYFQATLLCRCLEEKVTSWRMMIFLPLAALATFGTVQTNIASVSISPRAGLGYVGVVSLHTVFFVFNAALAIGCHRPH